MDTDGKSLDGGAVRLPLSGFVLDLDRGELLTADHRPAMLRKQALQVLLLLGARPGQVVAKDELFRRIWPDAIVTDDSLVQAICEIRRRLGDGDRCLVRNVPRRGYMLVPDAAALVGRPEPEAPGARLAASRGMAPGSVGEGDDDLLAAVLLEDLGVRIASSRSRERSRERLTVTLSLLEQAVAVDLTELRVGIRGAGLGRIGSLIGGLPDRELAVRRIEAVSGFFDRLDPDGFPGLQARTILAYAKRDWRSMRRTSPAWAGRYPHPAALGGYGMALLLNGSIEDAAVPLGLAVRLASRHAFRAEWQYRLAMAHFVAGRYEPARHWGEAADRANPALPWPPVHAAARMRLGQAEEARRILAVFLERWPGFRVRQIVERLGGSEPPFVEGRDRLIASLRQAGLG